MITVLIGRTLFITWLAIAAPRLLADAPLWLALAALIPVPYRRSTGRTFGLRSRAPRRLCVRVIGRGSRVWPGSSWWPVRGHWH